MGPACAVAISNTVHSPIDRLPLQPSVRVNVDSFRRSGSGCGAYTTIVMVLVSALPSG